MTFLAPIAWGLLALGIPIVALYLIKTRLRRKPVSTLLFWGQLKPPVYNSSLWRKLRRWVSLALQLLFLALLVFALAEPLARWQSAKAGAAVLVIDPSPSMWATDVAPSRWAQAMKLAKQRVAALRLSDECAVILAGDPPRVLSGWTGSRRTLRRALDSAAPMPGHEGMRPALALARNLAVSRPGSRIIVISDGAWAEPPDAEALAGVELNWVGTSKPTNTALTAFAARRSLAAPGDFTLAAELRHFGDGPVDGELEIQRDGHIMDLQPVRLEPGKPWQKTWKGNADGAVKFEARLRTFAIGTTAKGADGKNTAAADCLAADNRAEARLAAVAPISVDLVAPPNAFLDAALGSLPAISHRRKQVNELDPRSPAALTVFYRTAPPANFPETASALLIDPPGGGFWGEPVGGNNALLEHPLVSDYQRDSAPLRFISLDSVNLQKAREFRPAPGAEIFAQSFGKPLLFGRWDANASGGNGVRRWLVMPFDLENTDFALRTAFPVLLGNLTQSLRTGEAPSVEPLPGEVKSRLTRTAEAPAAKNGASSAPPPEPSAAWWAWAPLWWWAAVLGLAWLLAEWWSFSRRITE